MNGLNHEFMRDTEAFLHKYPMDVSYALKLRGNGIVQDINGPVAGFYDFDLRMDPVSHCVKVHIFPATGPFQRIGAHRIRAYWLPFLSSGVTHTTLGNNVRYFFTAALEGCRFQVVGDETPTVLHIAGNEGGRGGAGPRGSAWRERQALGVLGAAQAGLSRRFSANIDYSNSGLAFVVGFRSFRFRGWRFVGQAIQRTPQNDGVVLTELLPGSGITTRRI